ncbi:nitroreductase family protein [candidate division KSB1 bacterium]|nr:nitroreductase family protein [candidate division KSB1 bacterium]
MIRDFVFRNRSYRRFDQAHSIEKDTLIELIELARLSPSAKNLQPLKYMLSWTPEKNAKIFESLVWAGYLTDWPGPEEGERPTAYIIILGDKELTESYSIDPGLVTQSMMLGAVEKGLGGCIFGTVQRSKLRESLEIPEQYDILYVLAIGKPVEKVVVEVMKSDDDYKYWRDSDQVHHVPKRKLSDLIID